MYSDVETKFSKIRLEKRQPFISGYATDESSEGLFEDEEAER